MKWGLDGKFSAGEGRCAMAARCSFHPFVSVATGSARLRPPSLTTNALLSRTLVWTVYSQVGDARLPRVLDVSCGSDTVSLNDCGREAREIVTKGIQLKPLSREREILQEPLRKSGISHKQKVRGLQIRATAPSMDLSTNTDSVGEFEQDTKRPPLLTEGPYSPPLWASYLNPVPPSFSSLGLFPTPIHRWNLPGLPSGTDLWIKRDDLSGMEMSGNKVRKLEFLMADAMAQGADCVITIGGIQSNHCRATAVAARYLGLDAYLILRTSRTFVEEDPGLAGNLLVERLVGAHIDLVTKEEYVKYGSKALGDMLLKRLRAEGRKPYLIPVGGSNSLGTWGYIEGVREIELQLQQGKADGASHFDDIVMACGSGGTTAGLALGSHLSTLKSKVHAYAVCDDENYFYDFVQGLLDGVNAGVNSRDILEVKMAKGLGYAMSTTEELKVVKDVAERTGLILDPVYSGKAINGLVKDMNENPSYWQGRKVLFIHTGGLLGMYDKVDQLQPMVGRAQRMVFDSVP